MFNSSLSFHNGDINVKLFHCFFHKDVNLISELSQSTWNIFSFAILIITKHKRYLENY